VRFIFQKVYKWFDITARRKGHQEKGKKFDHGSISSLRSLRLCGENSFQSISVLTACRSNPSISSGGDIMSYVRWDPWSRIGFLQNRINQLIADTVSDPHDGDEIARCEWKPAVDIIDLVDEVVIRADLPGVKKDDVSIELKDNLITLKGERVAAFDENGAKCFRRERCFGTFFRAFTLPDSIRADNIRAVMKDGVLEIHFSKPVQETSRLVQVS
jgi:HSP20 family protein